MELARDFMIGINIDTINACNLKCPFCPCNNEHYRSGCAIDINTLLPMLDDLDKLEYPLQKIFFTGTGEPLLYENLPKLVSICKKYTSSIGLYTNGTLLTPSLSESLLYAGMTIFNISTTGFTPEVYGKFQGGNQPEGRAASLLETVKGNIKALCDARDRINPAAVVATSYILTEHSKADFFQYVDYYRTLGVKEIHARVLEGGNADARKKSDREYIEKILQYVRENKGWLCSLIGQSIQVSTSGDVHACCERPDELYLGNIYKTPLIEMLNGERFKSLLNALHEDYERVPARCGNCGTAQHFLSEAYNDMLIV
jgi:MoaA/NifB/PqqE/SkfB family radical SAM enzyme